MEIDKKIWDQLRKVLVNPAISLPLVTAITYVLAYFFEATYLAYFDVSHQFVGITVNVFVLAAIPSVGIIVYFLVAFVSLKDSYLGGVALLHRPGMLRRAMILWPLMSFIIAIGLYLDLPVWKALILAFAIPFLVIGMAWLLLETPPWVVYKLLPKGPVKSRLEAILSRARRRGGDALVLRAYARYGVYTILVMFSVISLGVITAYVYASTRTNFLVYETPDAKKFILIRSYQDRYILKSISAEGVLEGQVLVVRADRDMQFEPIHVERLK